MAAQYIYAEAANGMTVRIPKDQYPQWKETQDKIRAGQYSADPQMVKSLRSLVEKQ